MSMQQEVRRSWLPVADAIDRFMASGSRLRMHALAALARVAEGQAPIDYIHGPALPYEVVSEGPLARVLRYRAKGTKHKTPVLIVASLINRYYVLDLLPELSVIGSLCERGFDVWVLDWKAPGELGPSLRFSDYVDGAIAAAARETGVPVAMLGYCMGGTLATMFAARHPEQVKSLVLLGTPIDFHASGLLATWTTRELFDADLAMDVLGNMPPAMMQSGFKLMNPVDALFKVAHLFTDGDDAFRVRHRVAMESWLEDNVAFPGGVYREYISALYQDNALVGGTFRIAGDVVDLARLTSPLLNVIALRDHICAPPASHALMPRVGSTDKSVLEFNTGHIGLTTSRNAHGKLWPQVFDWMAARV
jgi:polyhydroxyalkanoate synthase subunit PhaC